jgi:hypothetical protein
MPGKTAPFVTAERWRFEAASTDRSGNELSSISVTRATLGYRNQRQQ